jgi:acetoin utilization deacetylase AcuC-like enzyme
VTEQALKVAGRHAHGRVVSTLEGGYNLHTLGRLVDTHIQAFFGTA